MAADGSSSPVPPSPPLSDAKVDKHELEGGDQDDVKRVRIEEENVDTEENEVGNEEAKEEAKEEEAPAPQSEHAESDVEMAAEFGGENNGEDGAPSGFPAGDIAVESAEASVEPDESSLSPLDKAKKAALRARLDKPEDLDPEEPASELPKHQLKYFTSAIKAIKRLKDAAPFLAPVDPIKLGIPDYFAFIKEPMDLGTMEKNLAAVSYVSVQEIVDDFNRIVGNCIVFNGEEAGISVMAKSIGTSFQKHLLNAPPYDESDSKRRRSAPPVAARAATSTSKVSASPPVTGGVSAGAGASAAVSNASNASNAAGAAGAASPASGAAGAAATAAEKQHLQAPGVPVIRRSSMTADGRPKRAIHPPAYRDVVDQPPKTKKQLAELKFCGTILRELMNRKNESISYPFLQPVDPVAQGVPHYHEVIKEPMDLSTMSQKLNDGLYQTAEDFESDFRLMLQNCYVFNPEGTPVNLLGHRLENLFDRRWLEKPAPIPTPPPGASDNDSEADEYEEAGITNPAIKVLEDNIASLKQQLRKLKREALQQWRERGGKRRSKAAGAARRASNVSKKQKHEEPITEVTYAMKKEISDKIPSLNEKKLRKVLAIIQESMPQLRSSGQDEIELDMDQLDESTQRQLYNFVVRKMEDDYNKPSGGAGANNSNSNNSSTNSNSSQKKKKSKPLTEDEQNRQIEEIQNKLAQFDQHKPGSGTPSSMSPSGAPLSTNNNDDDDSSSDEDRGQQSDSDDSSSEEE